MNELSHLSFRCQNRHCLIRPFCQDRHAVHVVELDAGEEFPLSRGTAAGTALHAVCLGGLKTVHPSAEGREAISALHFSGESVHPARGSRGRIHHVAICHTVVRSVASDVTLDESVLGRSLALAEARIVRDSTRIASLCMQSPPARLAALLLDIAHRAGGRDRLTLSLRRSEIAAYLGLQPETVSRAFAFLQKRGLIRREHWSRITLLDRAGLLALSGAAE